MEKGKRKAISHGVLALLIHIYESDSTDINTKRLITSKVIHDAELKDFQEQVDVLKEHVHPSKSKCKHFNLKLISLASPKTSPTHSPAKGDAFGLTVTGKVIKQNSDVLTYGVINKNLASAISISTILHLLESNIESIEAKMLKQVKDEEAKRRKFDENKSPEKNKNKRIRTKK